MNLLSESAHRFQGKEVLLFCTRHGLSVAQYLRLDTNPFTGLSSCWSYMEYAIHHHAARALRSRRSHPSHSLFNPLYPFFSPHSPVTRVMGVTSPLDEKLRLSSSPPLHPFAPINGETLSSAQRRYTAENPTYKLTSSMDTLRRREFKRLKSCKAYLDYTGAGLYPECLVKDHAELMSKHIFGNPHSNSPR